MLWLENRRKSISWTLYCDKICVYDEHPIAGQDLFIVTCWSKQNGPIIFTDMFAILKKSTCLHWYLNQGPQPWSRMYIPSRPLGYGPLQYVADNVDSRHCGFQSSSFHQALYQLENQRYFFCTVVVMSEGNNLFIENWPN